MKKLSGVVSKIIGSVNYSISLNIIIKKNWDEIVGDELKNLSYFKEAKYVGNEQLNIIIYILNSASLFAKYNEKSIIENLKNITGISKIKLIFKHKNLLSNFLETNNAPQILKDSIKKEIKNIDLKFDNDNLKKALEDLKTVIKF